MWQAGFLQGYDPSIAIISQVLRPSTSLALSRGAGSPSKHSQVATRRHRYTPKKVSGAMSLLRRSGVASLTTIRTDVV
jgi:hypothetical protein